MSGAEQVSAPPKNIVLCSDGTGNTANKNRGTNVFKLFEAIDVNGYKTDVAVPRQVAFYDDGVGTERIKPLKMLAGAAGFGLARNVRELYMDLCRCYHPGDRVFVFGFSRGAFTARTLAGLIVGNGIVDPDRWECSEDPQAALEGIVKRAWKTHRGVYRTFIHKLFGVRRRGANNLADFRREFAWNGERGVVHFIGVWDTVDAYGLPSDVLADAWNEIIYRFKFPDRRLHANVRKACHAVALDDERATFHPVMWDEREEIEPGVLAMPLEAGRRDARIEQVWFAGVHSNVGGGYTKQGLSLVSLDWMMKKAEDHGLQFLPVRQTFRELGNVNDTLYDSRSGLAIYYGYKPRDMAHLCSEAVPRVHISVFERIWNGTADYAPGPMPEGVQVVSTYGDVHHGENAVSLEHIGGIVTAAHRARHSAIPWIWTRRVAHMTLLAVTAFVGVFAWFTVPLPGAGDGGHAGSEAGVDYLAALAVEIWALMSAGIAGLAGVLWQIGRDPRLFLPMLAVLVAVWLVSRTAKRHIQGRYSRFWRELCAQTRNERSPADALRARVGR